MMTLQGMAEHRFTNVYIYQCLYGQAYSLPFYGMKKVIISGE